MGREGRCVCVGAGGEGGRRGAGGAGKEGGGGGEVSRVERTDKCAHHQVQRDLSIRILLTDFVDEIVYGFC
jgi:hypothetical protein